MQQIFGGGLLVMHLAGADVRKKRMAPSTPRGLTETLEHFLFWGGAAWGSCSAPGCGAAPVPRNQTHCLRTRRPFQDTRPANLVPSPGHLARVHGTGLVLKMHVGGAFPEATLAKGS